MKRSQPRARIRVRTQDPVLRSRIAERLEGLGEILIETDSTAGPGAGESSAPEAVVETPPRTISPAAGDLPAAGRGGGSITPREAEVLLLLADGLANKEIGARLSISAHTAKFHVESLLRKLDAANRAEAVREGIRRGLIGL
jgi:DNA-binding CsgD family transcriptional regulator